MVRLDLLSCFYIQVLMFLQNLIYQIKRPNHGITRLILFYFISHLCLTTQFYSVKRFQGDLDQLIKVQNLIWRPNQVRV